MMIDNKRQALSARTRFEIFKRDGFVCQYCGAHPPDVLLHCDHILPVAAGGGNDTDNLITACSRCNQGKSDVLLTVVPQSLESKAAEVREREAQIAGYHKVLSARRERIEDEMWQVAEELETGSSKNGFSRSYLNSIKRFLEQLPFYEVLEAAEIARARMPFNATSSRFRYFCGVCWRKIRPEQDEQGEG